MTTTHKTTLKSPKLRKLRAVLMCLAVLGLGLGAAATPMMSPAHVPPPIADWMQPTAERAVRGAYVKTMLDNGYQILPAMDIADGV